MLPKTDTTMTDTTMTDTTTTTAPQLFRQVSE